MRIIHLGICLGASLCALFASAAAPVAKTVVRLIDPDGYCIEAYCSRDT